MDILIKKKTGREMAGKEKAAGQGLSRNDFDACRCKEVSQMSLSGLLRLMMKDLSIWKRRRK